MELKIGEIFNFQGIILQVCETKDSDRCKGCFFKNYPTLFCPPHTCIGIERKDKKDIIFKKLINKMTREEAKELLPIIQAFAEGKTIQFKVGDNKWRDMDKPFFGECPSNYRIKPESKYRPFKSQEECWNEMLKHQPFGWVTDKCKYVHIVCVRQSNIEFNPDTDDNVLYSCIMTFADVLEQGYIFVDGEPFGINEK